MYNETCVGQPPLRLTLVVNVERWLSYKGTCHVILLAKLHDMYLYKTDAFFHISHYLRSVSKVALLHRCHCRVFFFLIFSFQLNPVALKILVLSKSTFYHITAHNNKTLPLHLQIGHPFASR